MGSFLLYHRRVALILVACMHWASLPFFSCYRVSRENSKSLFFFPTLYIHTYTVTGHTYTHSCPQHWRFGTQPGDGICFALPAWFGRGRCERACDSGVGESWGKV